MRMSQRPIWQIICNSSNKTHTHTHTHTHVGKLSYISMESFHIFLELWLIKFEKVQLQFIIYLCVIRNFNNNKVQRGSEQYFNQSPAQHRQNSIYSLHISQKMSFLFFLYGESTLSFSSAVLCLMHCCCHFLGIYFSQVARQLGTY